jgi:hypothetical protein
MDELEYLLKEYKERMALLTDALARNNVANMEDYRYICGQLRGLEAACAIIVDLRQNKEESFDE